MYLTDHSVSQPAYHTAGWRLYTGDLTCSVFDIETTGLSSHRDALILGGSLLPGAQGRLRQHLASSPSEERPLLEAYLSDLSASDVWISYNGDSFDRPFLRHRLRKHGICEELPLHQSVDLYRIFRSYSPMAKLLPDLRQTSVEWALGLGEHRTDEIDGRESLRLYDAYSRTGSRELREKILLHNSDDLEMLHRLMILLDNLDLHKIMFDRGFLVRVSSKKLLIEKVQLNKGQLFLRGSSSGISENQDIYTDGFRFLHNAKDRSFELFIPCLVENNGVFLDTELFHGDFSPLERYPSFINGYLLLQHNHKTSFHELNHLCKIILKEILNKI